ncbi:MAG: hemerythrin domain-containing protein [Bryobacteraceae bacterium]
MPVTIGAKPSPDFSNPIELLIDCHRRIERFLAVLMKIAAEVKGTMTKQQSHEWEQALDYFRNAAPRHTADEEESLFPRLRRLNHPKIERALADIQELEADHEQAAEWHEIVDQIGRKWLGEKTALVPDDTERLNQALANLSELYARHIALEDDNVFPVAAAVLAGTETANIGVEMAQRRGLDPRRLGERVLHLSRRAK